MLEIYEFVKAYFGIDTQSDDGATMVEYALLLALIAIVVIAALLILGPRIANLFNNSANQLNK
jgi:pilus assembly protein Flp/PilA